MLADELDLVRGKFEINPVIGFHFGPGVVVKQMRLPPGYRSLAEAHEHPHLSIYYGHAIVTTDDNETKIYGFGVMNIPAGVVHSFEAISTLDWCCISENTTDETDPEKVDKMMIGAK